MMMIEEGTCCELVATDEILITEGKPGNAE